MKSRPLDYSDLECEVFDADDMAHLLAYLVNALFEDEPDGGIYRLMKHEAELALFAARMMSAKARAVREKWEQIDQQKGATA